jgi:hypothetical protein
MHKGSISRANEHVLIWELQDRRQCFPYFLCRHARYTQRSEEVAGPTGSELLIRKSAIGTVLSRCQPPRSLTL